MRVISSSAANGSSISRIFGRVTSARAIDTRIFMPPESWRGWAPANADSPTCASASSTRSLASRLPTPESISGRWTLSATVRHGSSVGSWNTKPSDGSGVPATS